MAILIGTTKDGSSTDGRTLFPDGRNQEIHHLEKDHQTRSYSPPKTIFVVSLQGTPGAHDSNNGRLDLFKEKWRNACGSSSAFTHIEHCAAPLDSRRGYGVTWAWILCVWRARQLNEEAVIFLEDDARLFENSTDDFCDVKRRGQLLSKLPDDTFLAFLGGHTWFYKDTKVPFRQVRHSYGAYGFVVPRESIDDFYEALSSGLLQGRNKALNPEDIFYSAARRCHKSIYAFNPLIVWHEGGYSNTWGRVRGNITGLESHKQGINTSSGRKRLVTKIATRPEIADQEQEMNYLHKPSTFGAGAAKCTFCEGKEMSDGDLIVPDTGGKTCISIKAMAAGEVDGSEICAIMQKEETVCCPEEPPAQFANSIPMNSPPAANGSSRQRERGKRQKKSGNHGIVWAIKPSKDHDYVQGYVAEIKPASLCACAKCGSTAFWEELFAIVQGKSFQSMNYTGPSTIHNLLSKRIWTNIQAERRTDWLDFEDHDSFALIRDPKERIISAWKDKVSCEHAHVQTKFFVHGLLKLAGSGNNITARVSKNGGFPCLDLSEYLELMSQIHALGKEGFLEEHFLPQNLGCFKDAPPSIWTHVTTVSDPNGRCSLESVVLKSANMSKTGEECLLLKRHVTRMKQSLKPTRADEAILDAITRNEYEMLGQYLPKVSDTTNDDKAVPVATLERVGSKDEGGEHEAVVPPITNIATRPIADQEHELNHPDATKCTFCEGKEMPNGDLIVPDTGEKTCSSIKAMAAGEVNGNEICAIMQKEETVCCPKNATIQEVDTLLPSSWNISAIIPACKRLHSLRDAIESALKQTYPVLEVIVAIDSNPDCVNSINNIWEGKDNRVRVLKVPPCPQPSCGTGPYGNLSRNRNYAIGKTSPYATHFAMLDDDDLWYSRKTEMQVKKMQEGNYSYSSSDANMPSNGRCHGAEYKPHDLENEGAFSLANGGKFKKYVSKKLNIPLDAKLPSHITRKELSSHNIFIASATLFSKDIFYATSGFDEGVDRAEDHSLWLQFAKIRPGLFITDPLVVYDNNRNGCDVNYTSDLYVEGRVFKPSPPRLSDVGSKEEEKGGAHVDEAQILQTSSQPQRVHFRTYGNERYNWTKARIVQEALDTGWFASVKALGPDDLTADFKKSFEDILKLPRGGGYWIWKYNVIEQTLESMNEGDFLVYLDAGSRVNKGGEKRFREYLKIVNESQYDMLCFQYPFVKEKYTTGRIFRAFNISMEDPIRTSGQIEGGTLLMQKGPHLRSWLKIIMDALLQDPWIITDKYNREEKALNKGFKDNRHDQSISSVSRKIHGCEKVSFMESNNKQPDQPFHVMRLRKQPKE